MINNTLEHEFQRAKKNHMINTVKEYYINRAYNDDKFDKRGIKVGFDDNGNICIKRVLLEKEELAKMIHGIVNIAVKEIIENGDLEIVYNEIIELNP